jgi:ABC-type multidrug transport system permease subunit
MFVLPIVFMGVFAVAFGGDSGNSIEMKVGVWQRENLPAPDYSQILSEVDSSSAELDIATTKYADGDQLRADIKSGKIDIGLVVEAGTTAQQPFAIKIIGKESGLLYIQRKAVLQEIVYSSLVQEGTVSSELLVKDNAQTSAFDTLAPGLIIYGLLILIPGIAQGFASITEKNYIYRFANSKAKSVHLIAGSIAYFLIISVIQTILLYVTAQAFGYKASGNILLALVPALCTALFVIGIGLLIGSFVKNTDAATNLGTIVSIILGFFSGSFISGIGNVLKFDIFGQTYQFNDIIPSKWGTVAIEKVLSQNLGLADITTELTILLVSGIVIIALGTVVYQKKQLSAHS